MEQAWKDWNRRGLDPLSAVIRGGVFCEKMAGALCSRLVGREAARELSQFDRLKLLEKRGLANPSETRLLHRIRQARNQAAHEGTCPEKDREEIQKEKEALLAWFCRADGKLSGRTKQRRSMPGLGKAAAVVLLLAVILVLAFLGSRGVFSGREKGELPTGSAYLSLNKISIAAEIQEPQLSS